MPLGTEVDLGPGDIVLDGNPAPPKNRGHSTPNFGPCIVAKRLHVSRCHLVGGLASTQVTLCYMGTQLPPKRGTAASGEVMGQSMVVASCLIHSVYCTTVCKWDVRSDIGVQQ